MAVSNHALKTPNNIGSSFGQVPVKDRFRTSYGGIRPIPGGSDDPVGAFWPTFVWFGADVPCMPTLVSGLTQRVLFRG